MPRIPRLAVLALFLVTLSASAAQLVAPRPIFTGPLPYEDLEPESVSNGETTLIAWTNAFSPYGGTHRLYVRLLDGGEGILLGSGTDPRVATNGRDYLVAHSIGFSRFLRHERPCRRHGCDPGRLRTAPGTRRDERGSWACCCR
jgi:hypothetical protein